MKQISHPPKGKSPFSQHKTASFASKQPEPEHFGSVYVCYKYGTMLILIVLIAFAGINILGDISIQVEANRKIFDVYETSENFVSQVDRINALFQKQSSKYVSNNVVNLYSNDINSEQSQETEKSNDQFNDLINFSDFVISQRYYGKNVLYLPLNFEDNNSQFLQESYSSKILSYLKRTVQRLLKKFKITQPNSVKQLKWNRVRKLLENGKIDDIFQLINDNIISRIWIWARSSPQAIILTVSEQQKTHQISPKMKKSFKKWIRQNDQQSEIIILSKHSMNKMYDMKQNTFKALQVQDANLENVNNSGLCKYVREQINVNEDKCQSLKEKFSTLTQLEKFVKDYQPAIEQQQSQECIRLLDQVCLNGHVRHYFYDNQQNANKVVTKTSKGKKNRTDRELQSLLAMWSHIKKSMGLNRIKDVFWTLTSGNEESTMSLRDMNEKGLVYDFELHELKWRGDKERLEYEISNDKVCKNGKVVLQEMDEQVRVNKKEQQAEEKKAKQQQQKIEQQQQEIEAQQQEVKLVEQQLTVKQQQGQVKSQQPQAEQQQQSQAENKQEQKSVDEQAEQKVNEQQQQVDEQEQQQVEEEQQQQQQIEKEQQQKAEQKQQQVDQQQQQHQVQNIDDKQQQQQVIHDEQEQELQVKEGQQKQVNERQQQQQSIEDKQEQTVVKDEQAQEHHHQIDEQPVKEQNEQLQEDDKSFIVEIDIDQINFNDNNEDEQQQQQDGQQGNTQDQQQPQQKDHSEVNAQTIPQSPQHPQQPRPNDQIE